MYVATGYYSAKYNSKICYSVVCHIGQKLFKNCHIILNFVALPKECQVIHKLSSSDEIQDIKIYSNDLFFKCKE
jgi:hypothetical protein